MKDRKAQTSKGRNSRKAQEEIVGFSMIIVIVAVILITFISLSWKPDQKQAVESYEAESFLQSLLQKTSDCRSQDSLKELYSLKNLMFRCYANETCLNGENSCDMFTKNVREISNRSWNPGPESPVKGYVLNVTVNGEEWKVITQGNITKNSKGSMQEFSKDGKTFGVGLKVYY